MEAIFEVFNSIYPVSKDLATYLASNIKCLQLKKGEFLVKKHRVNTIGSFVNSGLLHCYYLEKDKKITSWFLQEKSLAISVQSFFSQKPSYEFIQALEPSEIYYLTHQELEIAYKKFMELNYIIRELLQEYYMLKEEHAYQLQKGSTAKSRFDWFANAFPEITTRVPKRHIASFLGVTEETLSRIRKQKP
jgi:CRP/FNR family transcriptional regulator, anaerobic regulatory protein